MFSTGCAYLQKKLCCCFSKLLLYLKVERFPTELEYFFYEVDGFPSVADCNMVYFKEALYIIICVHILLSRS